MLKLVKILEKRPNFPVITYLPATASEIYKEGEALVVSSGAVTKCDATAKPTYVAFGATPDVNGNLPVFAVTEDMLFEVPVYADEGTVTVAAGTKYTLHTTADTQITTTSTNGVIEVVEGCSSAAIGTIVKVRIR